MHRRHGAQMFGMTELLQNFMEPSFESSEMRANSVKFLLPISVSTGI